MDPYIIDPKFWQEEVDRLLKDFKKAQGFADWLPAPTYTPPKEIRCAAPGCKKMNDFGCKTCWMCGNELPRCVK